MDMDKYYNIIIIIVFSFCILLNYVTMDSLTGPHLLNLTPCTLLKQLLSMCDILYILF